MDEVLNKHFRSSCIFSLELPLEFSGSEHVNYVASKMSAPQLGRDFCYVFMLDKNLARALRNE